LVPECRSTSDDIVIIVGSSLVASAGVGRSGIIEMLLQRYARTLRSLRAQLALLAVSLTVASAFDGSGHRRR
jgi:hypothetical protein